VDASLSQVAVADGAKAENTMVQAATIIQFSPETVVFPVGVQTTVDLVAAYILDVDETAGLPPRSTDLMVRFNADGGTNSAINSSAASQEQAILQTAAGGVDEDGAITENGGTARNTGASSASNVEGMRVTNSISVSV
jgi:hypothetical protein